MTRRHQEQALVDLVAGLDISADDIADVITRLCAIGSSRLGFRTTGTPEDAEVADVVAGHMRAIGLADVAIEPVEVDAWRFLSADVALATDGDGAPTWQGSSFGGVPGTPDGGLTTRLVDVGDPRLARLDRLDLAGSIALVDWRSKSLHPSVSAFELAERGVAGMLVSCPEGGAWYQGKGALGGFDGHWPAGGPPMVMMAKEDAARLREHARAGAVEVTMTLRVEMSRRAAGHNVVGYLPGEQPGPVVVGAHHDAWFQGAFDNTSGVAAMLAIAKALVASGHRPRHTVCFSSRTGEEYGLLDSPYDWCVGAWRQVATTHPEWGEASPFHLCLEATGHPALRSVIEAPVELRAWARRIGRLAAAQGWTPTGWRVAPPVTGTEQWPYLVSGVPGVAAYAWETSFADTDYHTQRDTPAIVDCTVAAAQARLYALLLLAADATPDDLYDYRPRARELAAVAERHAHPALAQAAADLAGAKGRAAFTAVGRGLHGVNGHGSPAYPQAQAATDLEALAAAVTALENKDRPAARRHLRRVGVTALGAYLSQPAFARYLDRYRPDAIAGGWAEASHVPRSPDVWAEHAALGSGPKQAADTGWVHDSLLGKRDTVRRELDHRLDAMARATAFEPHEGTTP